MGEARQKLEMDAAGIPRPRDPTCPACGSRRVYTLRRDRFPPRFDIDCDWAGCGDCTAVWEAFPALYARDPVCAEPCDNCAFRPGSPEQQDPAGWRDLIESLRPGASMMSDTRFYCHKGAPIDMTKGPGNYLFPRKPLTMSGKTLTNADGSEVTIEDTTKMRVCSGYLRMLWALRKKHRNLAAEGEADAELS